MSSLKGFIPGLAKLLSSTPLALYERQRALVRAGLLSSPKHNKRGPGGGIQATAPSVSLMLISMLSTDNLSAVEASAGAVAAAKRVPGGAKTPFPPSFRFMDALAAVLAQQGLCREVDEVRVSRTAGQASIRFKTKYELSEFRFAAPPNGGIQIEAALKADVLQKIGADVAAIN